MDWFTADLHLGHGNILKYCRRDSFLTEAEIRAIEDGNQKLRVSKESLDRHDAALIDEINKVVERQDTLRIVGDFCFGRKHDKPAVARKIAFHYAQRINCRHVHLVLGNHDKKLRGQPLGDTFERVYEKITIKIEDQKIALDHEAHAIWDCRNHGAWHLYGHSHGGAEEWLDSIMPGRFSMDVGVDWAYRLFGAYRPISFPEIKTIMDRRSGFGVHAA